MESAFSNEFKDIFKHQQEFSFSLNEYILQFDDTGLKIMNGEAMAFYFPFADDTAVRVKDGKIYITISNSLS